MSPSSPSLRNTFMQKALLLAQEAYEAGEIPVGAVIVHKGQIIAEARNEVMERKDITAHAEILVIQRASALLKERILCECDLYVTLEPCPMCAQAISFAQMRRLYYGATDPKSGGIEQGPCIFSHSHWKPEVYEGILFSPSETLLKRFFKNLRSP